MLLLDNHRDVAIEGLTEPYMRLLAKHNPDRYELAEKQEREEGKPEAKAEENPAAKAEEPPPAEEAKESAKEEPTTAPKKRGRRPNRIKSTKSE